MLTIAAVGALRPRGFPRSIPHQGMLIVVLVLSGVLSGVPSLPSESGILPAAIDAASRLGSPGQADRPDSPGPITAPQAAAGATALSSPAVEATNSEVDFGAVIEKVRHAVTSSGDGRELTVEDRLYRAEFADDGFRLKLRQPPASGTGEAAGFQGTAPFALSTSAIELEGHRRVVDGLRWHAVENTAERSVAAGVVERVTARDDELEWDFVLDHAPAKGGSLRIEAKVSAPEAPARVGGEGSSSPAWRWRLEDGRAVRMGEVVVIDAMGRELHRSLPAATAKTVALSVPAEVLADAHYPLTVDPVISPEYPVSDPVYGPAPADQKSPAVAFDGSENFLVVWAEYGTGAARGHAIHGARVTKEGVVVDPAGIPISSTAGHAEAPTVAFDGTNFLVTWQSQPSNAPDIDIVGALVSTAGRVLTPAGDIPISTATRDQKSPAAAFDGTTFLVVWTDARSITPTNSGTDLDIYGARVAGDGQVHDIDGIAISTAAADQKEPALSFDGTNYLVVWTDHRLPSTVAPDIYGARVTGEGHVLEPAGVPISTEEAGVQSSPAVAFDGSNFLVVWMSRPDGVLVTSLGSTGISGARVSALGVVLDPSGITISHDRDRFEKCTASCADISPSVAFDGTMYLVVWVVDVADADIHGARVSVGGSVEARGIPVSTAAGRQSSPAIAMDGTNLLIVWDDNRNGSQEEDIYGARMPKGQGDVLEPSGILVSTTANTEDSPAVAFDGTNYLVAWSDLRTASLGRDIYASRVTPTGDILDSTGIVVSQRGDDQDSPAVAFDGENFVVVWRDHRTRSTNKSDVYAARVTTSGTVLDKEGIVVSATPAAESAPSIAAEAAHSLVVWSDQVDIFGARLTSGGGVLGSLRISAAADVQDLPTVAFDGTSSLVVWRDYRRRLVTGADIYGTRVSPAAGVLDPSGIAISGASNDQDSPAVVFDMTNFFVVWRDDRTSAATASDVYGARVSSSGTVLDLSAVPISTAADTQDRPAVAFDGTNSLVVWRDYRSRAASGSDVYGTRVSSSGSVLDDAFGISADESDELDPAVAGGPGRVAVGYSRFSAEQGAARSFIRFVSAEAIDQAAPRALTVSRAGTGSGSVGSDPAGVDCGSDCNEAYPEGTVVTLTAVANDGSVFAGWSGDCSGTGTCTLTMSGDRAATATFNTTTNTTAQRTLTVSRAGAGTGSVTSTPEGIDCGVDCSENYDEATGVRLTAAAGPGNVFDGWSGDCSGTGTCVVTMSANRSVTAAFNPDGAPVVSDVSPAGSPTAGGTTVVIEGSRLDGTTSVKFGSVEAASFSASSDSRLTAVAPPHEPGIVQILVTTPAGANAATPGSAFTYADPYVTAVSPAGGPPGGGTSVTISGGRFEDVSAVRFGDAKASFTVDSPTKITAVSPRHSEGSVDVTVVAGGKPSPAEPVATFTYATPSVAGIRPAHGAPWGGAEVVITGTSLEGTTSVKFGAVPAAAYRVDSNTQITAVSPPQPAGTTAHVVVSDSSSPTANDLFTYYASTWVPTGSLISPRRSHTATLLSGPACTGLAPPSYCGKVLVTGGSDTATSLNSAELYDPASGGWVPVAPMASDRSYHTATLLDDGQVLVAGGEMPNGTKMASAELFDPAANGGAGAWLPTGSLAEARSGHTATLLGDGTVVVVGGQGGLPGSTASVTAERFDPGADNGRGAWTSIATERSPLDLVGHTATLLSGPNCVSNCGKVLIVSNGSAELYDPETRAFVPTGPMPVPVSRHTATLLRSGNVLVAGGSAATGPTNIAQIYNPATGSWLPTGPAIDYRYGHVAALLPNGKVLVAGGEVKEASGPTSVSAPGAVTAEVYDPEAGSWSRTAPMGARRPDSGTFSATVLGSGLVLVAGGTSSDEPAELFDAGGKQLPAAVEKVEPSSGPTFGGTAVTISGRGLFPATEVRFGDVVARVTFASDRRVIAVTPPQLQGAVTVSVTARGATAERLQSFTYGSGAWLPRARTTPARASHTSTTLDGPACRSPEPADYCGKVLVVGGVDTDSVELYDPATGQWRGCASTAAASSSCPQRLPTSRASHTATLLDDARCHGPAPHAYCGKVLVAGGANDRGAGLASAELYDPATGRWSPSELAEARFGHTATVLNGPDCKDGSGPQYCGKVLVTGGAQHLAGHPPVTSSELYDPATGTWSSCSSSAVATPSCPAPLLEARGHHSATLLPDGRVLATGGLGTATEGVGFRRPLSSAEVYDPATGKWSGTAPLNEARWLHTATSLDIAPCGESCGKVLVVGGGAQQERGLLRYVQSAELYDPVNGTWAPTPLLHQTHAGHTATLLESGHVLVAGRGAPIDDFPTKEKNSSSVELFDPVSGGWAETSAMSELRANHTATRLDGPPCRTPRPPSYCGRLLVVGGSTATSDDFAADTAVDSAELYAPAPTVTSLAPASGATAGGTVVTIRGRGFSDATAVAFGGTPATRFEVKSPTEISAEAPPRRSGGPVEMGITNAGGTSAHIVPDLSRAFFYVGAPGQVIDLSARPAGHEVVLGFSAPDDGTGLRPATRYVVKQSTAPIDDDKAFEAATSLCGGTCSFATATKIEMSIRDLEPGTTYFYSLRALNAEGLPGLRSNTASATTDPAPVTAARASCVAPPAPGPAQLAYRGGHYSIVGLPAGTKVGADSPLYGWFDKGAGGQYSVDDASAAVEGGRGYWAWFRCGRVVDVAPTGDTSLSLPLGAYHASMVGNPSPTAPAHVTGHDFAARWDPTLNEGAGGYVVSGYREPQSLAVGDGLWTFSYEPTEIRIEATG